MNLRSFRSFDWAEIVWFRSLPWSNLRPCRALRVALGVALPLLIGVSVGALRYGGFAALGALSAGFASFHGSTRDRMSAVLISSAGMAVTTFVGAATAATASWLLVPAIGLMGLGVGAAVGLGPRRSVAALQWPIALLVADGLPLDPTGAAARAGWVLAGGVLQALLVLAGWAIRPRRQEAQAAAYRRLTDHGHRLDPSPTKAKPAGSFTQTTGIPPKIDTRTEIGRHALRLAVAASAGQAIALAVNPHDSRWIPLTIFVVLQPDYVSTLSRGLQRAIGTTVGAGLGVGIVEAGHLSPTATALAGSACVAVAYGLFEVSYALYSVLLTAFVVVLLDYLGTSATTSAPARVLDTLIGAGIALVAFFVWPTGDAPTARENLADAVPAKPPD